MIFEVTTVNMINLICIAIGIGVCSLCFIQVSSSTHLEKTIRYNFQIFFALIILYIAMHLERQLMDGLPGDRIRLALKTVTFIEITSAGLMAFVMSLLVMAVAKISETKKVLRYILIVLVSIHVIILVAGLFNNAIYYFDENNIYHRGSKYILSNLCPFLMLILDAFVIYKFGNNIRTKVKIAFLIYIFAPVVAIIIQSMFYGLQLIIFATVSAAVYMFSVIISDLNEKYEAQQQTTARIGTELKMATDIQASQLPRLFPAFPERVEFDLYASMEPAKEVGGDFYDFFLVDDDHIGLVMADVSGKGVPAALFMMISRVLIKTHLQNGESPATVLTNVNNQLCDGNEAQLFVTVWLAVIELSTGKGIAANAGHEHPAIRRKGSEYKLEIYRHMPAVATMEGINFREHEFALSPGDSIFVYTDGVTEATNAENELYGNDRLLNALNKNPDAIPKEVLENVASDIDAFAGDAGQFDDITMMCLYYHGK